MPRIEHLEFFGHIKDGMDFPLHRMHYDKEVKKFFKDYAEFLSTSKDKNYEQLYNELKTITDRFCDEALATIENTII